MEALSKIACMLLLAGAACMPAFATTQDTVAAPATARDAALDLGVVIDFRRVDADGVTVLAVTPGGPGERLGLLPGDRIVAANGSDLTRTNRPSSALSSALTSQHGELRLEVIRDGRRRTLAGSTARDGQASLASPIRDCGHISSSGSQPRATRDIFPVLILGIDGNRMLPARSSFHRVEAGRRVVIVRELIDDQRFTRFGLEERRRQRERQGPRLDKVLIIDVQPGTTYAIGARTSRSISTSSIRDNSFWEPVVWRTTAQPCR